MNPFKTVQIKVKTCLDCSAMHQVFPYEYGMCIGSPANAATSYVYLMYILYN